MLGIEEITEITEFESRTHRIAMDVRQKVLKPLIQFGSDRNRKNCCLVNAQLCARYEHRERRRRDELCFERVPSRSEIGFEIAFCLRDSIARFLEPGSVPPVMLHMTLDRHGSECSPGWTRRRRGRGAIRCSRRGGVLLGGGGLRRGSLRSLFRGH